MFAVGVLFYLLLVKKPLFDGDTASKVFEKNKKLDFHLGEL